MSNLDRRSLALERSDKRRSAGSRFTELGDRLAKAFAVPDRPKAGWESEAETEYRVSDEREAPWDQVLPRFPVTRHGYDCAAVDQHITELEQELADVDRELAELRARTPAGSEVAAEIQRIGEQTSEILLAAHDKAHETTRQAQDQADRCLSDAAAQAIAMTQEANRKLQEMEREKQSVWRDRARLLDDVSTVASAMTTLAKEARERFPGEPEKPAPVTVAAVEGAEQT